MKMLTRRILFLLALITSLHFQAAASENPTAIRKEVIKAGTLKMPNGKSVGWTFYKDFVEEYYDGWVYQETYHYYVEFDSQLEVGGTLRFQYTQRENQDPPQSHYTDDPLNAGDSGYDFGHVYTIYVEMGNYSITRDYDVIWVDAY